TRTSRSIERRLVTERAVRRCSPTQTSSRDALTAQRAFPEARKVAREARPGAAIGSTFSTVSQQTAGPSERPMQARRNPEAAPTNASPSRASFGGGMLGDVGHVETIFPFAAAKPMFEVSQSADTSLTASIGVHAVSPAGLHRAPPLPVTQVWPCDAAA